MEVTTWSEDMWVLVLQLLMRKPTGVKPMYAPQTVDLALELHIPPEEIYRRMFMLRKAETPSLRHLMDTLGTSSSRLSREAKRVRKLRGCGNENLFFEGVEVNETFEKNFKPISGCEPFTPIMLIMILDLYFQLIPATMVVETPDVQELARMIGITAKDVVRVLALYQNCDPYIIQFDIIDDPLLPSCQKIWREFEGNADPSILSNTARQLRDYWK